MIITSGQTVKTFVSSAYQCQPSFVRKHGFEYINLRESKTTQLSVNIVFGL